MKIIELFGGIGACSAALKRLGIDKEIFCMILATEDNLLV